MSFIYGLAIFLVVINLLGGLFFVSTAVRLKNGRRLVRLLAMFASVVAGGVYLLVVFGVYPNGLPPELGRLVVALHSAALFSLGLTGTTREH